MRVQKHTKHFGLVWVALLIAAVAISCSSDDDSKDTTSDVAATTAPTEVPATATVIPTSVAAATAAPAATATQRPVSPSGPEGKITVALSGVGPDNYELYQLAWPWNDRNQFIGIYDTLFYDDRSPNATSLL
jgi:predicted secreted protein